jgi:glycosyltransferase involved in cell wall biosynthesis
MIDNPMTVANAIARVPRLSSPELESKPPLPRQARPLHGRACSAARWALEKLLGVHIFHFHQHRPRALYVPPWYFDTKGCQTDLTVSIVTPSYNQGAFLERTIQSVLNQKYPRLEYIIQDGGSSDSTADILDSYRDRLTHCESRPDRGQAHALNLGFKHARGEILGFLNSDDLLLPGTLHYVADFFARHPEVDVVYGHRVLIDENDEEVNRWVLPRHDKRALRWMDFVPQETMFWRRRIWEKVGAKMDESFQFALDWDLLLRFRDANACFQRLPRFLGAFRLHSAQKSETHMADWWASETKRLCERYQTSVRYWKVFPYFLRQALYQKLYRFGLLRY